MTHLLMLDLQPRSICTFCCVDIHKSFQIKGQRASNFRNDEIKFIGLVMGRSWEASTGSPLREETPPRPARNESLTQKVLEVASLCPLAIIPSF